MSTQSKSCITSSLSQADRIVAQLRAADFSADEISVLMPSESRRESGREACHSSADPGNNGNGHDASSVLVSVHLEDERRMGRAEEIFCRADSEERVTTEMEDERPQSWVNSPFARSL
jgi:hypothetical protein